MGCRHGAAILCAWLLHVCAWYSPPAMATKTTSERKKVIVHTDGGASGNPGPGGWAAVLESGEHRKELSGGYRLTTNNRMELTAAIRALEALKQPCDVTLFSDSQYVVHGVSKGWARKWRSKGWMRNKTDRAINPDLWAQLLDLDDKHKVTWKWVKGHAGHELNERCDELAVKAAKGKDLPVDVEYEKNQ